MKATDVLMEEHRVIERVLDSLLVVADRLAHGGAVRPGFFLDVADFASGFADGCHHRKEEGVLFPTLTQHGMPAEMGPIAVMLHEHDAGRTYVRQLRDAAKRLDSGDNRAAPQVVHAARGYAALLRDHIAKEDEVLFPMAADMIPAPVQDDMLAAFEHVEHDETGPHAHTRFLELAQRLQQEAGKP